MKLKGKVMWCFLSTPDTKFQPQWRLNLLLDKEEAKKARDVGLKPKKTDEYENSDEASLGEYRLPLRRYCEKRGRKKGQQNNPPIVVDSDNNPFVGIVGNGSTAVVTIDVYTWSNKKYGSGVGADLSKVKVIDLIEYIPDTQEEGGLGEVSTDSVQELPKDNRDEDEKPKW